MEESTLSEYKQAALSANNTLSKNADSAVSAMQNEAEDIDNIFKKGLDEFLATGFNGQVDLNKNRVTAFKQAIGEYVTEVNNALEKLSNADASRAFGPVIGKKVGEFVSSIKEVCQAMVGNLNAFQVDLEEIRKAYEAKEQNVSDTVSASASTISGQASGWKYTGECN